MKFVSLGVLLLILICSWRETQRPSEIPASMHMSLQTELQQFIQKYVAENVPSAKEIQFRRLWTKPIDIDTVDAQFEYSFLSDSEGEGTAKTMLAGSARLNRVVGENPGAEGWSLARVQIDDQTIEFEQGVLIRSDGKDVPVDAPSETEAPAGAHGHDEKSHQKAHEGTHH